MEYQNITTTYVLVYFGGCYLIRINLLEMQPVRVLTEAAATLEQALFLNLMFVGPCIILIVE